jgi:hypothetical protein
VISLAIFGSSRPRSEEGTAMECKREVEYMEIKEQRRAVLLVYLS